MVNEATREATKAFGRYLATPTGHKIFAFNGWVDETPVVVCDESDRIMDVFSRANNYGRPLVIAIHFPHRKGQRRFGFMKVEEPIKKDVLPGGKAGVQSTIGMLFESAQGRGKRRYELGDFAPVELGSFELTAH